MKCLRCQSVMIKEVFEDYGDVQGAYAFTGWHCMICGAIIDPVILSHQTVRPSPRARYARMQIGGTFISSSESKQTGKSPHDR